mmetsp:Transcript_36252/g.81906  ORF Transcript_36252/g.81906 Transcript_36252/m.81906 type:complete len:243 (+) Transcript_36252:664-1392(+)
MDGLRGQRRGRRPGGRHPALGTGGQVGHQGLAGAGVRQQLPHRVRRRRLLWPAPPAGRADVRCPALGAGLPQLLCSQADVGVQARLEGVRVPLPRARVLLPALPGVALAGAGGGPPSRRLHNVLTVWQASAHGAPRRGAHENTGRRPRQPRGGQDPHGPQAPDPRAPQQRGPPSPRRHQLRRRLPGVVPQGLPARPPPRPRCPGRARRGGAAAPRRPAGSSRHPERGRARGPGCRRSAHGAC